MKRQPSVEEPHGCRPRPTRNVGIRKKRSQVLALTELQLA
eukprot:CAMPEP_0204076406 /NCGR_PEP_ID=MMETSP0360-20130528/167837_1 /ASSEMBLY_ACC=CAM_ASM_000342 /TAXON_ID=268821 /ORGANISM="Scrippsiella Hangoei, Strain SHTV-5" /LENGTH=39 /DNA_ID= /DNA_START= /DNA_END= /DNA_ORIENTATION=